MLITSSVVGAVLYTFNNSRNGVGGASRQTFRGHVDIGSTGRGHASAVRRHSTGVPYKIPVASKASNVVSSSDGSTSAAVCNGDVALVRSRAAAICMVAICKVNFRSLLSFVPWFGDGITFEKRTYIRRLKPSSS